MRGVVDWPRMLVTITARGRHPPRLEGVVSLSGEPIKTLYNKYIAYRDELLCDAHSLHDEQERLPAL